jgi:hypothetical protein
LSAGTLTNTGTFTSPNASIDNLAVNTAAEITYATTTGLTTDWVVVNQEGTIDRLTSTTITTTNLNTSNFSNTGMITTDNLTSTGTITANDVSVAGTLSLGGALGMDNLQCTSLIVGEASVDFPTGATEFRTIDLNAAEGFTKIVDNRGSLLEAIAAGGGTITTTADGFAAGVNSISLAGGAYLDATTNATAAASDITIAVVFKKTAACDCILSYTANAPQINCTSGALYFRRSGGTGADWFNLNTGIALEDDKAYILVITASIASASIKVRVNGQQKYEDTTQYGSLNANWFNTGDCSIGRDYDNTAKYFVGEFGDLITIPRVLTDAEIDNLESYLSYKFQIGIGAVSSTADYVYNGGVQLDTITAADGVGGGVATGWTSDNYGNTDTGFYKGTGETPFWMNGDTDAIAGYPQYNIIFVQRYTTEYASMYQTVAITSGRTYKLSFYALYPDNKDTLQITIGDTILGNLSYQINTTPKLFEYTFTATESSPILKFTHITQYSTTLDKTLIITGIQLYEQQSSNISVLDPYVSGTGVGTIYGTLTAAEIVADTITSANLNLTALTVGAASTAFPTATSEYDAATIDFDPDTNTFSSYNDTYSTLSAIISGASMTVNETGINGFPAIDFPFEGIGKIIADTNSTTSSTEATVVVVFKRTDACECILSYDAAQPSFNLSSTTNILSLQRAGKYDLNTGITIDVDTPYILVATFSGSEPAIRVRINGVQQFETTSNYSSPSYNISLCNFGAHSTDATKTFFVGLLGDVITAATVLSATEIDNIEQYLSNKYQIGIGASATIYNSNPFATGSGSMTVNGGLITNLLTADTATVSTAAVANLEVSGLVMTDTLNAQTVQTRGVYHEGITAAPWVANDNAYLLDYNNGGVFYISGTDNPTANFNIQLINLPTDTSRVYTISLVYYQPSTAYYCNGVRARDTTSAYILATASTFESPKFSGGAPSFSATPNLVIQQFTIVSFPNDVNETTRYVISSVAPFS